MRNKRPPIALAYQECRELWAKVARKNGWYKEPSFVQVWYDAEGNITDSVSHRSLDRDYLVEDEE